MDRSLHKTRASDGQVLLLAVLIMIAILLVGTLFVAIVNYNKRASGRHTQLLTAMSLAVAGMAHANEMLQFSPQGLDWRPDEPPLQYDDGTVSPLFWGGDGVQYTDDDYYSTHELDHNWPGLMSVGPDGTAGNADDYYLRHGFTRYPQMGRGHFLLRVTYDPDPPYEEWQEGDPAYINPGSPRPDLLSKYIKIESIGVTEHEGFVYRKVQAYKPVALANYLLFVSDRSRRGYPTLLGYNPWIDMDKDGGFDFFSPAFAGTPTTYTYNGPMRFNTNVQFTGGNNGGGLAGASNKILLADGPGPPITGQAFSNPLWGGYLRDDYFETHGQVTDELFGSTGQICAAFDVLVAGAATLDDLDSNRVQEQVDRLSAPDLFARDPATGTMRWDALTREAGVAVTATAPSPLEGQTHNTAELGWMWDASGNNQIAGLYIDNYADLQHVGGNGVHYIDPLMQEWLNPQPDNGGWNALGEVYDKAPAVEIELFPTETATREYAAIQYGCAIGDIIIVRTTADLLAGLTEGLDANEIWWPNHNQIDGEPGIRLSRGQWSDDGSSGPDGGLGGGQWALGDPSRFDYLGAQVGRTMYVDYPAGGRAVIYAEGNIRIKGRLPQGNYHLTVVSGGTIYIDGQILSPQDQYGRDVDGSTPALTSDEENTYIALLARDCVVVNPTMLVPQFDKKQTNVAAQNDPGENYPPGKHWQMPPSQVGTETYAQSQFYFGAPPVGSVHLTAYQGLEGEGGVNSTTLTAPLLEGWDTLQVADPVVGTSDPDWVAAAHHLRIIDAFDPSLQWDYNLNAIIDPLTLRIAPNAVHTYSIGSEVINLTLSTPAVTGIKLSAYDPASGAWIPYDFDIPPASTSPPEPIFVLTRRYLGPGFGLPWVWEGSSLWAPLHDTYWPWLLNGYIDSGAGALNALKFVMPTGGDIVTANGGRGNAEPYLLKKFKLQEFALGQPTGTIHAKINAVMYAQDGCFFVIPGRYFKEDVLGADVRPYLRYNYDVEIRGAITENFHPGPAVVREWQEKWAYPDGANWNSIRYVYDETLLAARTQPVTALDGVTFSRYATSVGPHSNTVKLPLLPASPDLLYYGEVP